MNAQEFWDELRRNGALRGGPVTRTDQYGNEWTPQSAKVSLTKGVDFSFTSHPLMAKITLPTKTDYAALIDWESLKMYLDPPPFSDDCFEEATITLRPFTDYAALIDWEDVQRKLVCTVSSDVVIQAWVDPADWFIVEGSGSIDSPQDQAIQKLMCFDLEGRRM